MNQESTFGLWIHKDMDWIQATLNLIEGNARIWCLLALEKLRNGELPYNGDWRKFEDAFTKRFIPLDLAEAACEAIKWICQGNHPMAKYKAKFNEHANLTGWSRNDLHSHFYDGLSDIIKDALAISDCPTEAYDLLVEAAQVLDIRL
jgi:hypothetical protein